MTDADEKFLERLNRGPAGLLLGQQHLALGATRDPFLAMINRKLDKANITQSYSVLHSVGDNPAFLETQGRMAQVATCTSFESQATNRAGRRLESQHTGTSQRYAPGSLPSRPEFAASTPSLNQADMCAPLPWTAVTSSDRAGRHRAARHGRRRADPADRRQAGLRGTLTRTPL